MRNQVGEKFNNQFFNCILDAVSKAVSAYCGEQTKKTSTDVTACSPVLTAISKACPPSYGGLDYRYSAVLAKKQGSLPFPIPGQMMCRSGGVAFSSRIRILKHFPLKLHEGI